MTRAISGLLSRAASAAEEDGVVPTDIAMSLSAEGYDLSALDRDVERILAARAAA